MIKHYIISIIILFIIFISNGNGQISSTTTTTTSQMGIPVSSPSPSSIPNNNIIGDEDILHHSIDQNKMAPTLYQNIFNNLVSLYNHHSMDDMKESDDNNSNLSFLLDNTRNHFNIYKIMYQFNQIVHKIYTLGEEKDTTVLPLTLSQLVEQKNKLLPHHQRQNSNDQKKKSAQTLLKHIQQQQLQNDQLLPDQFSDDNKFKSLLLNSNTSNYCSNIGVLGYQKKLTNTCQTSETSCRPTQMICNGQLISVNLTTPVDPNIDYSQCHLLEMKCLYNQPDDNINFKNQYQLEKCNMNISCRTDMMWQCIITNVICDTSTTFNDQAFAFTCTNKQLVCNGQVVPESQYNTPTTQNQIFTGKCTTQLIPCNPTDQCLDIQIDCESKNNNCTLETISNVTCSDYCINNINTSMCICPADYTGSLCHDPTPFTCNLDLIQPIPTCHGDKILTTDKCFSYKLNDNITFSYQLNCQFDQPIPTPTYPFTYWIDLPNFKLSRPVNWNLRYDIINFYKLFSDYSFLNVTTITKEQIMGQSLIWVQSTLNSIPSDRWIAKRVYFEVGIETQTRNSTLSRFFVNALDYPDNQVLSEKTAIWKLILIIVAGALFVIGLFFGSLVFYRRKYRVNAQSY